jgi:hypothetical protein
LDTIDQNFQRSFGSFVGNTTQILNNFFKEMESLSPYSSNSQYSNEYTVNNNFENGPKNLSNFQNTFRYNYKTKSGADKDIYDV